MKKTIVTAIVGVTALVGITACGTTGHQAAPSKAACATAIKSALDKGMDGAATDKEPKQCNGLSDKEVTKLIEQAITANLRDQGMDATFDSQ